MLIIASMNLNSMSNESNIKKTERILQKLSEDKKKATLLGEQGMLVLARKLLPTDKPVEGELSVEEQFIGIMQSLDQQVQSISFLEEVFSIHLSKMKEEKN